MAPKQSDDAGDVCTYATIRIDDRVLPWARAAASLDGDKSTQEFVSDVVLAAAARVLGRKPFARRKPPVKPRGKGWPKGVKRTGGDH